MRERTCLCWTALSHRCSRLHCVPLFDFLQNRVKERPIWCAQGRDRSFFFLEGVAGADLSKCSDLGFEGIYDGLPVANHGSIAGYEFAFVPESLFVRSTGGFGDCYCATVRARLAKKLRTCFAGGARRCTRMITGSVRKRKWTIDYFKCALCHFIVGGEKNSHSLHGVWLSKTIDINLRVYITTCLDS